MSIKTLKHKIQSTWTNMYLFTIGKHLRILKKPRMPKNLDGKTLIHIGCGACNDSRYINVDARPGLHIHAVNTIENLPKIFPENYADLIYACHILEHIPYGKIPKIILMVWKCLKQNGVFRISVPNFEIITQMYAKHQNLAPLLPPLMGGQGYPENFHYSAFDHEYLKCILMEAGFKETRLWDPKKAEYYNFDDWAGRSFLFEGEQWPISLNIEAIK